MYRRGFSKQRLWCMCVCPGTEEATACHFIQFCISYHSSFSSFLEGTKTTQMPSYGTCSSDTSIWLLGNPAELTCWQRCCGVLVYQYIRKLQMGSLLRLIKDHSDLHQAKCVGFLRICEWDPRPLHEYLAVPFISKCFLRGCQKRLRKPLKEEVLQTQASTYKIQARNLGNKNLNSFSYGKVQGFRLKYTLCAYKGTDCRSETAKPTKSSCGIQR